MTDGQIRVSMQPELFAPKHRTEQERVEAMVAHLAQSRVPVEAIDFRLLFRWSDRTCRALAERSGGRVIGTNRGYIATARATADDKNEAIDRLRSQAQKMIRRATAIEREWHTANGIERRQI